MINYEKVFIKADNLIYESDAKNKNQLLKMVSNAHYKLSNMMMLGTTTIKEINEFVKEFERELKNAIKM